jgi:hypothetical protein
VRNVWLVFVVACSGTSPATDAAVDAAVDATVDATSSCLKRVSFQPFGLTEIAVDGTSVLANLSGGLMEIPLDGSTPINVATTATQEKRIAVTSHNGVAVYAIVTATATEVRRRDGTVIATLPVQSRLLSLRMNATDFYVLAQDSSGFGFWRVPRSGAAASRTPFHSAIPGRIPFELGTTILAYTDGIRAGFDADLSSGQLLDTFISDQHYGMELKILGDTGVVLTGDYSRGTERLDRFYPTTATLLEDSISNDVRLHMFADDRYVYVVKHRSTTPPTQSITAIDPVTLQQHPDATCPELSSYLDVVFDQTNLYGVQKGPGSTVDIVIAPRAP